MYRIAASCLAAVLALALPAGAGDDVVVEPVSFEVVNPLEPLATYTVNGSLYRPASDPGCDASVTLLLHGLSYGAWAWDFPLEPETYSTARALAAAGLPAVAVDRLGYGDSPHPDGHLITVEGQADAVAQIAGQLRRGDYGAEEPAAFGTVGLAGHSAGSEISHMAAGFFRAADFVVLAAYTHFPGEEIVTDFFTSEIPRALIDDYTYFGETPDRRSVYMYNLQMADPAVVALDTQMAHLTPSGEILSIGKQPSRFAAPLIDVPVLLVLAEEDFIFPVENAGEQLALYVTSPDAELYVVPEAGHTFTLHPNAPQTNAVIGAWIAARAPAC